jgi:hypothetical protein
MKLLHTRDWAGNQNVEKMHAFFEKEDVSSTKGRKIPAVKCENQVSILFGSLDTQPCYQK